jgi:hypothetical protein
MSEPTDTSNDGISNTTLLYVAVVVFLVFTVIGYFGAMELSG